ncbi:hypothetical protein CSCA_0594 [Clostridium scatologenes]|uniref:Uncharacterized protein n=1 Tax=Clostridium scatologenes TaxID=1548 RepID=A0A0E3M6I4_CLOSL|nr:hypothetical protein CSCA_0594 [Clostridium scatologenes]
MLKLRKLSYSFTGEECNDKIYIKGIGYEKLLKNEEVLRWI